LGIRQRRRYSEECGQQGKQCGGRVEVLTMREYTKNPEKLSWVRVSMKMVLVAQKLSTIEQHKEQNCFFQLGDYRN
jgi:hypothetical protein